MSSSDPHLRALAEAAMDVAKKRAEKLDRMRAALLEGDNETALDIGRQLTGLVDEESNRTDSGLH